MQVRRVLSFLLALVITLTLTLAFVADVARADDATYTVRYSDNLTSIAARNGVTVQALAQANGIANVNSIFVGQVLKMPSATSNQPTPAPVTTGEQAYIVQAGDTLSGIAAHYGISMYDLAAANHLSVMSYIYTGQTLRVPQSSKTPAPAPTIVVATTLATSTVAPTATPIPPSKIATATGSSYTIQNGDTLSTIATRFNVPVSALVQANHIIDPSLIVGGQTLVIPGLSQGGGPAPANTTAPPVATTAPAQAQPPVQSVGNGKWIDVDLTREKLTAYEGSTVVYTSLVSTGISIHPTVVGTYNIYVKYNSQLMTGPGYYLPNVPYVMYFYEAYAIHGTYWHNNFGHPMSHGCVNLPTPAAQWMYSWASIGTPVKIHY